MAQGFHDLVLVRDQLFIADFGIPELVIVEKVKGGKLVIWQLQRGIIIGKSVRWHFVVSVTVVSESCFIFRRIGGRYSSGLIAVSRFYFHLHMDVRRQATRGEFRIRGVGIKDGGNHFILFDYLRQGSFHSRILSQGILFPVGGADPFRLLFFRPYPGFGFLHQPGNQSPERESGDEKSQPEQENSCADLSDHQADPVTDHKSIFSAGV